MPYRTIPYGTKAVCLLVVGLCLLAIPASSLTDGVVQSRKLLSQPSGLPVRSLQQDAELDDSTSSELYQQAGDLTEDLLQTSSTDTPAEATLTSDSSSDSQPAASDAVEQQEATASTDADDSEAEATPETQAAESEESLDSTLSQASESGAADADDSTQTQLSQQDPSTSSSAQADAADSSSTLEPASAEAASTQQDASQEAIATADNNLTFDQALQQASGAGELSDASGNDLTFAEAVAATRGTESVTDVLANNTSSSSSVEADPTDTTAILEADLPSYESLDGSLTAATTETASNASAGASSNSSSSALVSGLVDTTAVDSVRHQASQAANTSGSLLGQGATAITNNSAVNATRGVIAGAASSAASLLTNATSALSAAASNSSALTGVMSTASNLVSNATSALTASTNVSALNSTHSTGSHATAGGVESDSALPGHELNSSMSSSAVHSGVTRAGAALSGAAAVLNSTRTTAGGAETQDNAHHDFLRHDHHEDVVGHPRPSARDPPTADYMQLDAAEQLGIDEDEDVLSSANGLSTTQDASRSVAQRSRNSGATTSNTGSSRPTYSSVAGRVAGQRSRTPAQRSAARATDVTGLGSASDFGDVESDELPLRTGSAVHESSRRQLPNAASYDEDDEDLLTIDTLSSSGLNTDSRANSAHQDSIKQTANGRSTTGRSSATAGERAGSLLSRARAGNGSTDSAVATAREQPGSRAASSRASALDRAAFDDEEGAELATGGLLGGQGTSSRATPRAQSRLSSSSLSTQELSDAQREEQQEEEVLNRLQDRSANSAQGFSQRQSTRPTHGSTSTPAARSVHTDGLRSPSSALSSAGMAELDNGLESGALDSTWSQASDRNALRSSGAIGRGASQGAGSSARGSGLGRSESSGHAGALSASLSSHADEEHALLGTDSNRPGAALDARLREHDADVDEDYLGSSSGRQSRPSTTAATTASSSSAQLPRSKSSQAVGSSGFDDEIIREYESDAPGSQGLLSVPNRQPSSASRGQTGHTTPARVSTHSDARGTFDPELEDADDFATMGQGRFSDSPPASLLGQRSSSSASDTRTSAQRRESEREMAFRASTGGSHALPEGRASSSAPPEGRASSSALGQGAASKQGLDSISTGAGSHQPLSQSQADQWRATSSGIDTTRGSSGSIFDSNMDTRQQPLGDGASDEDIGDYNPMSNFGLSSGGSSRSRSGSSNGSGGSSGVGGGNNGGSRSVGAGLSGQSRNGGSSLLGMGINRGQEEDQDSRNSLIGSNRGSSALKPQQSGAGAHLSDTGALSGMPVGKTQMTLDADEDEETPLLAGAHGTSQGGHKGIAEHKGLSDLQRAQDGLAGPIVASDDEEDAATSSRPSSKPSKRDSTALSSIFTTIVDNWVAITALTVFACTGAVVAFVFLGGAVRGWVPNPYEAISVTNVGTGGYAGNNGYAGVNGEDEESGWGQGWNDDDNSGDVTSPQQRTPNSNSPPRATGVGKLKKGSFAKKKPENWSNDF